MSYHPKHGRSRCEWIRDGGYLQRQAIISRIQYLLETRIKMRRQNIRLELLFPGVLPGYNLVGNPAGCSFSPAAGDRIGTPGNPLDAQLGPLADNGGDTLTHALLPEVLLSTTGARQRPAVVSLPAEAVDQRGIFRPKDGNEMAPNLRYRRIGSHPLRREIASTADHALTWLSTRYWRWVAPSKSSINAHRLVISLPSDGLRLQPILFKT
jgi:hypothetical protein